MPDNNWVFVVPEQVALLAASLGYALLQHINKALATARSLAPTKRIRENVQMLPLSSNATEVSSGLKIQTDEAHAPEACAYEFGSGLHDTLNARQKYIIRPKNKSVLAFDWGTGSKQIDKRRPITGKGFYKYVYHPGVVARPYLAPAILEEILPLQADIEKSLDTLFGPDHQSVVIHFDL